MNRIQLHSLSMERLEDARLLLSASRWSGAYYLVGYSLECALKSCVLAYVDRTGIIFQDKRYSEKCWTHDLRELVRHAGLSLELDTALNGDPSFARNWVTATRWTETSRYQFWTQLEAESLFNAIDDKNSGIMQWATKHW